MAKIGYLCVGTNDFDKATAFYTALLGEIGGKPLMPTPAGLIYRLSEGAMLMVTRPHDGAPATFGNGTMIAIQVDQKDQVSALHAKALELGGTCEGQPGPRGAFGDFAYFRDLDGNKLAVYYSARM
ncbi:VOC family protein [Aquidulcibacter sp.]|uniref:VOC family protein n=1 Tax=Aquidulcibacter sp. TaxID=2052990 RepID=UPI0025C5A8CF|nr:VOC family protein [Aquidulcibacter sp.]MCA3695432.1 VOC family protein [Aquidulcibacter sp.]